MDSAPPITELLEAFRANYYRLEGKVREVLSSSFGDSVVAERLGDELDEFGRAVHNHRHIFSEQEAITLETNILIQQSEVGRAYQEALDSSHHGRPIIIENLRSGGRGRPRLVIDAQFLRWAYGHRGASGIAQFLNVSRTTVQNALLEYGIAQPGHNPFPLPPGPSNAPPPTHIPANGDGLQPIALAQTALDSILQPDLSAPSIHSSTVDYNPLQRDSSMSPWSDVELDDAIARLRVHYPKAGIGMMHGMLQRLGHRVPKERIRHSLLRVDPVRRVFERIRIKRRKYSVPGPNSLWHHDGQHGLIRWGIVIHGFIDGYSRLITGLRASNNNRAATVLDLFIQASRKYGLPSRLRGDHGVENLQVAAYMELQRGVRRGSYIWGRSVHNVRIERLWVDVTAQFGAKWADFFSSLELRHGLNVANQNHRWLLHYLFLTDINAEATFWAESWNRHKIQMRGQATRSPADMFGFDMYVHGVRGEVLLPQDHVPMSSDELEIFGVDWEGLREDNLIASHLENNGFREGTSSWVGQTGPPADMNEVPVHPPVGTLLPDQVVSLHDHISPLLAGADYATLAQRWCSALAFAQWSNPQF